MPAKVLRLLDEIKVAADLKSSAPKGAQLDEPPLPTIPHGGEQGGTEDEDEDENSSSSSGKSKSTPLRDLPREEIIRLFDTKSDAIRALSSKGMTVLEISKKMRFRYQHVRNVLQYRLKRKGRRQ